LVQTLDLL